MSGIMSPLRLAFISVHTSPLAPLGLRKSGGMNVYIHELARELGGRGHQIDIFTYRALPNMPEIDESIGPGARVISLPLRTMPGPLSQDELHAARQQFAAGLIGFATRNQIRYDLAYSPLLAEWLGGRQAEGNLAHPIRADVPHARANETAHRWQRLSQRAHPRRAPNHRMGGRHHRRYTRRTRAIALALSRRPPARSIPCHPGSIRNASSPGPPPQRARRLNCQRQRRYYSSSGASSHSRPWMTSCGPSRASAQNARRSFASCASSSSAAARANCNPCTASAPNCGCAKTRQYASSAPLPQRELPTVYAAADLVIMPSDYESFGMVALEAQASGRPVIATQVGGLAPSCGQRPDWLPRADA